jgi:xanthine dehydrogenase YagT iron-sulfur-binding subunit
MQDAEVETKLKSVRFINWHDFGPDAAMESEAVSISRSEKDRRQLAAMSRRAFLKSTGLAVVGATAIETGFATIAVSAAPLATGTHPPVVGPGAVGIILNVNGIEHLVSVEPSKTLVDVLRDALGLTGTKIGCGRGSCSACTVWLDGVPIASCMLLAIDAEDRRVTTIEGLASGEVLHPVQAAFVAHDAVQCGFCTPGLVMSCAALIEGNRNPTPDDVRNAISSHLCRCGTLPHVVTATLDAAKAAKG